MKVFYWMALMCINSISTGLNLTSHAYGIMIFTGVNALFCLGVSLIYMAQNAVTARAVAGPMGPMGMPGPAGANGVCKCQCTNTKSGKQILLG